MAWDVNKTASDVFNISISIREKLKVIPVPKCGHAGIDSDFTFMTPPQFTLSEYIIPNDETWNYSKAIDHNINAFEMRCYRRMLRISCTSDTTNIDEPQIIDVKETTMLTNMENNYAKQLC